MPAKINLLNQIFGQLTVIEETNKRKNNSVVWKCQCSCGNEIEYSTKELRSDGAQTCLACGNSKKPNLHLRKNIIGNKYSYLLVLEETTNIAGGKILYKCQCDCGNIIFVNRTDLQRGHTKSCGKIGCIGRLKFKIRDIVNNRQILDFYGYKNERFYYKVKCLLCGKEYETLAQSLERTISCGCQRSKGEFYITRILIENNIKFSTQYIFKELPNKRYDFALLDNENNPIRLIEFDGEQHYSKNIKNSGWNTKEHYLYVVKSDDEKNIFALSKNIPLVRIPYWERENLNLGLILGDTYLVKD